MGITTTAAFTLAASGTMNQDTLRVYTNYMKKQYERCSQLTGWVKNVLDVSYQQHENIINSGLWELSSLIKSTNGSYVERYNIGQLTHLEGLRNAKGRMEYVVSANPQIRSMINDGSIYGYGDIGKNEAWDRALNYQYQKAMDGVVHMEEDTMISRNYFTSKDDFTRYTQRERTDIQITWRAANQFIDMGYDPTHNSLLKKTE